MKPPIPPTAYTSAIPAGFLSKEKIAEFLRDFAGNARGCGLGQLAGFLCDLVRYIQRARPMWDVSGRSS